MIQPFMKASFFYFCAFFVAADAIDYTAICNKCIADDSCRSVYNLISEQSCAPTNVESFRLAHIKGSELSNDDEEVKLAVAYAGFLPKCVDSNEQYDALTDSCTCLEGPCRAFVFSYLPLFVNFAIIGIFLYVIVALMAIVRES